MATNYGIRSEFTSYTIAVGQEIDLKIFDLEGQEMNASDLKFESNNHYFVSNRAGHVTGIREGRTSIDVVDNMGNCIRIPIQIVPANNAYRFNEGLPIFMKQYDRESCYRQGIYNCHAYLEHLCSIGCSQRVDFSQATLARLYAREAALFELPQMDRNVALLAAFAGIRNIYDLSRVNVDKALSVFKIISPMAKMFDQEQDPLLYPDEETIRNILDRARKILDFSSKYAKFVIEDPEPTYLLDDGIQKIKTDTQVISEALEFLQNISISLPLPRTISGKVTMKKKGDSSKHAEPQRGYKVTVTGIANPASDKSEDEEDLHAFTGDNGEFIIVMPEKYNLQETVKFTVSHDASKDGVAAMTSEEKLKSLQTATFVKRASEILKAMRIEYFTRISKDEYDELILEIEDKNEWPPADKDGDGYWLNKSIPAIELLEKLDRLQEANKQAKQYEDEIQAKALTEYDREQLALRIDELTKLSVTSTRDLFDELSYHLYLKETEYDEVKGERNRLIYHFDKDLKRYLEPKADALEEQIREEKASMATESANGKKVSVVKLDVLQHKLDVIRTLKVTCKKEDDGLFRYMIDHNYDYNLRDEIAENATAVRREELVEYFETDQELSPKLQAFLDKLKGYNEKMDALKDEIALLEKLVKFAEVRYREVSKAAEEALRKEKAAEENAKESAAENAEETQNKTLIEEAKVNPATVSDGATPAESEGGDRLKYVDEEHQPLKGSINNQESFDFALASLFSNTLEDCGIFGRKYNNYKSVFEELTEKRREFEKLSEVEKVLTRKDLFDQYLIDHAEDDIVIKYTQYNERANKLFHEIQDMDDTIGVTDIAEFEETERNKDDYQERTNGSSLQGTIHNILTKSMDAKLKDFELIEENFKPADSKPRALPTVRLMGEGRQEVELPTDTAPSRVFNYSILQRLVEPSVKLGADEVERTKIIDSIDIMDFKEKLYNVDENVPIASSLGIGYVLNMHQAWIPDGFALGNLLYSMILAPGEEQRIVVREHAESYMVNDDASAMDSIRDEYVSDQIDHETAAFQQAVLRASDANSDYSYSTKATSFGASASGGWGPFSASASASVSTNSGKGSASAAQNDSYDEISTAAQDFQTSIKTQSERLASAKRLSLRVASSKETESVSSKIVANHNHSHVMTVQYWEVTRRYKMETCIEGIDLILFVPLKPVSFLPDKSLIPSGDEEDESDETALSVTDYEAFSDLTLLVKNFEKFDKKLFNYRYQKFLRYADILDNFLPRKYRGGLELIKKYSAYPEWKAQKMNSETSTIQLKLVGYFLEYDNISVTLHFNHSNETIAGELESSDFLTIHPSLNTRKDVIYAFKKLRTGYGVMKIIDQTKKDYYTYWFNTVSKTTTLDEYFTYKIEEVPTLIYTFYLPAHLSKDDVSYVTIENNLTNYDFTLSQDREYLMEHELKAIENYEHRKYNLAQDDYNNAYEWRSLNHFRASLPECYARQIQTFKRSELISFGGTKITAYISKGQNFAAEEKEVTVQIHNADGKLENAKDAEGNDIKVTQLVSREPYERVSASASKLLASPIRVDVSTHVPVLGYDDVMKIEETFRHVTTNSIRYSLAVWSSLNEIERTMLLEQYTVDLDYDKIVGNNPERNEKEKEVKIPLLNCINVKKPLGFYGNCMLFPFTYPQELAEKLGKTAGDIQDELYRYHTTNFRVPSTSISVPTRGMIGEAVLGRTNVSEKIDVTRFWNWKDSEIDHIELDQKALNGHSLLDKADTKWVDAPTQGVAATEHVNGSGLLNSLTSRPQPTFADVLSNTDIRGLLQNADNNASAGREQVVKSNADMTKSAITAATDFAKAMTAKASAVADKVGDKDNITSALKKMGLSDAAASSLSDKIASGEVSYSDALTAISNAGGKSLGGLNDSREGGETANPENQEVKPEESHKPGIEQEEETGSGSFGEIINYAINAIEAGLTPVEMFNQWMKEKKGADREYTEADIKQMAEAYCAENGTSMDEVIKTIEELGIE